MTSTLLAKPLVLTYVSGGTVILLDLIRVLGFGFVYYILYTS
jgi:hypothetical protein